MLSLDMAVSSLEKAKATTAALTGLSLTKNKINGGSGGSSIARTISMVETAVEFCPQVTYLTIATIYAHCIFSVSFSGGLISNMAMLT